MSEKELHDAAGFMQEFIYQLEKWIAKTKNDEDDNIPEIKLNRAIRIVHELSPSVFLAKNPTQGIPLAFSAMTEHSITFISKSETKDRSIIFNSRVFSSHENNLDRLAFMMIDFAVKNIKDSLTKPTAKRINRVRFYYTDAHLALPVMKVADLEIKASFRHNFYNLNLDYIVKLYANDDDAKKDKTYLEDYVIVRGWRANEIHQLKKLLEIDEDTMYYTPPTRESTKISS